jgi:soluble lytic murein transglycosylase-like protein
MGKVIDAEGKKRTALWAFSAAVGVCLLLRASDLPLESVAVSAPQFTSQPAVTAPAILPKDSVSQIAAVARDIGRRFHLGHGAAVSITKAAFDAAEDRGIDPTLVLAVAAVESKFKPGAVNPATGATGLMQVVPKWHQDKVLDAGGETSLLLIAPNIDVGAAILAEYVDADAGNIGNALGRYLGKAGANRYVKQVQHEMEHLAKVLRNL